MVCLHLSEVLIDYWTYTENAFQNTIGREPEVQIVFTAWFETVYDSHLYLLYRAKYKHVE